MKTDLFQSCGHCWVFQICWHIECSTLTAPSFRILSSSAGIPSPPLALFIVMRPRAHLTSHPRMSGSRWVIIPLWLSESLRPFCVVLLCILVSVFSTWTYYFFFLPVPMLISWSFKVDIMEWQMPFHSWLLLLDTPSKSNVHSIESCMALLSVSCCSWVCSGLKWTWSFWKWGVILVNWYTS